MATYYRWRKSTVQYSEQTYSYPLGQSVYVGSTVYYGRPKPSIASNGLYSFTYANVCESGYGFSAVNYFASSRNPSAVYGDGGNCANFNVVNGVVSPAGNGSIIQYSVLATAGTSQGYVYSTSSTAYPNGGVSGSYYYDQRTTVTSPTPPTGLTYPNPITTPTVTVSWNAATSNVPDYPVDHYNVYYGFTDAPASYSLGSTTGTSKEVSIPIGITSIKFEVEAVDSFGTTSGRTVGPIVNVYLAPTLTVPSQLMQGQQATVSWTAIDGADSYTLQRKANTDADWTQVYSGANLSYSETVGTWTSVQYRVQAVFSGTPGGWAESAAIPVVSSSALVISGQDGDLGTVVNDIPYSISTDTGNQITATITVNSAVIFSGNVGNSTSDIIPVLDLVNGEGTIVIEASVTASGGPVSAVRTWTYTKAPITFPNAGSVAQLTKEGENIFPKTLAECVRLPGGGTLDQVMGFPAQVYTASYTGTGTYGASNPTQISFPFVPDLWGIVTTGGQGPANLFPWGTTSIYGWTNTGYINATCSYSDKTVSISGASAVAQANSSNLEHCFIGIKVGTEAAE